MLAFLKLILAFLPWLTFLFVAHGSLFRLELGLGLALAISVVMGVLRLHRGVILWCGLAFFTAAAIAVIGLRDMWTIRHMGILANAALGLSAWATVLLRRPFTLDYARDHMPRALWDDPRFVRTNVLLTSLWAATFSVNAVLAWGKMAEFAASPLAYELLSYALLVGTAAFTVWYPAHLKRVYGVAA
jgi:hypothetical protein